MIKLLSNPENEENKIIQKTKRTATQNLPADRHGTGELHILLIWHPTS
ncbi:MAG: hypothetical protein U1C58_05040 [Flavobacteriaceae bacterium]|nr:hypothetical protein [Flavobacteriaceae bacterium]MDZ4147631.1 hypothetical protein [Flavobacteriaceae bacterium]